MSTRDHSFHIAVDGERIAATLVSPATAIPGVLFVHGWRGSQEHYLGRAREVAALGAVCVAIDLRGHGATRGQFETVTREDNLRDVLAAYDVLVDQRNVDSSAIAVVGSSYGGYLAAILTSLRPVKWLGLRVPALYEDADWDKPKHALARVQDLQSYRRRRSSAQDNRALRACSEFKGDVLIVESEHDDTVPHPVIESYIEACKHAHSLTYRVIQGADHGLSDETAQRAYTSVLVNWLTEMVFGARQAGPSAQGSARAGAAPQEAPPQPG